jgi:hydroxypyruvate isomerase
MVKLSVCIEPLWENLPEAERIRRIADLGFEAFEFWRWSNKDLAAIRTAMDVTGLPLAAMTFEPGHRLIGRGALEALREGMQRSIAAAKALSCSTLIVTAGNTLDDESSETSRRRVVRHLQALAPLAEDHGLTLVLEPLNTLVNHHGYWLTRMSEAVDIVREVDSPAVRVLMDLYHQQITEGNLIANLTVYIADIGHFHAAGVPGRHELVGGELDYSGIFRAIDAAGYDGYVGLEYWPLLDAETSLRQALALR